MTKPILVPPPDAELIELKTATVWFEDDDVAYAIGKEGVERNLETVKETCDQIEQVLGDQKKVCILDVTNTGDLSMEGRNYLSEKFPMYLKAVAVLSGSSLGTMIANIFLTVKKQPYPVKFFNSVAAAREWVEQHRA